MPLKNVLANKDDEIVIGYLDKVVVFRCAPRESFVYSWNALYLWTKAVGSFVTGLKIMLQLYQTKACIFKYIQAYGMVTTVFRRLNS